MKRIFAPVWLFLSLCCALNAQNTAPVILKFSASVDWDSRTLTLLYDVEDAENDPLEIAVGISGDGGKTYSLTNQTPLSGDVGFPVMPGPSRSIQCDLSALNPAGATFSVRLVADDKQPFDLTAGLAHLQAVRDSMSRLFGASGLFAEEHTFTYGAYTGRNVLGTLPGTFAADTVVIVDAHYDSVANAPGADDNGSGTVGVMELARLLSRYPSQKSLRFIGFDLEEAGLAGSSRYVSSGLPAGERVAGVFNFEMIGYYTEEPNTQDAPLGFNLLFPAAYNQLVADSFRGNFITNVGYSPHSGLADLFRNSAATYVPDLKVIDVIMSASFPVPDLLRSDHAPFWNAGLPALMITDGADFRNKCYHTPADTLDEKLNFTFMSNVVKATLAAVAQLAGIRHGDWAVAKFDGTVGAADPLAACAISVARARQKSIQLLFNGCTAENLHVALFDVNGRLLHRELVNDAPGQGIYDLDCPDLSAGIYFVKISAPGGSRTVKVALP
ncbi:MAG: M28 family peptidase [Thermoanaerobaculia bacterium]|nr:M28 family peptidase [Thermoanaerobaculia bacterium]